MKTTKNPLDLNSEQGGKIENFFIGIMFLGFVISTVSIGMIALMLLFELLTGLSSDTLWSFFFYSMWSGIPIIVFGVPGVWIYKARTGYPY